LLHFKSPLLLGWLKNLIFSVTAFTIHHICCFANRFHEKTKDFSGKHRHALSVPSPTSHSIIRLQSTATTKRGLQDGSPQHNPFLQFCHLMQPNPLGIEIALANFCMVGFYCLVAVGSLGFLALALKANAVRAVH
jgi:hypothetical protein